MLELVELLFQRDVHNLKLNRCLSCFGVLVDVQFTFEIDLDSKRLLVLLFHDTLVSLRVKQRCLPISLLSLLHSFPHLFYFEVCLLSLRIFSLFNVIKVLQLHLILRLLAALGRHADQVVNVLLSRFALEQILLADLVFGKLFLFKPLLLHTLDHLLRLLSDRHLILTKLLRRFLIELAQVHI